MIYVLEDDRSIRELLVYALGQGGFAAEGFEKPSQLDKAMKEEMCELLILDIMLPEEDGLHILKRLRRADDTAKLPIILLTAKDTEYDKVIGLDAGADDYVSKPFGMMELVSRVRALLRRTKGDEPEEEEEYSVGDLHLSVRRHIVTAAGREVQLTMREYKLLECMMKNKGVVFTRDSLLSRVWGYEFDGESRTVDVHIRTLRQKLGECEKYIETVRGMGYKVTDQE
ncbi:MAG: response regulator transcription factor [Clostridia bacterium]|nr:response regulator transcription factor [Clostridia bacterium]